MIYQSPISLKAWQLQEFAAMANWDEETLAEKLLTQHAHVFLVDGLWLLLAKRGPALAMLGAKASGPGVGWRSWRKAVAGMLRLCADWQCEYIETSTTDVAVGRLIKAMGGRPYEVTYRMEA